jgi:hypothetical protein
MITGATGHVNFWEYICWLAVADYANGGKFLYGIGTRWPNHVLCCLESNISIEILIPKAVLHITGLENRAQYPAIFVSLYLGLIEVVQNDFEEP